MLPDIGRIAVADFLWKIVVEKMFENLLVRQRRTIEQIIRDIFAVRQKHRELGSSQALMRLATLIHFVLVGQVLQSSVQQAQLFEFPDLPDVEIEQFGRAGLGHRERLILLVIIFQTRGRATCSVI